VKASNYIKAARTKFSLETNHHFAPLIISVSNPRVRRLFLWCVTRETLADVVPFHNLLQFSLLSLLSLFLTGLA
jgi:hypothetical protein